MPFLVDSHNPSNYEGSLFHKETYERLKKMSQDDNMPHVIFHGPSGSGKKTMTDAFLHMIYGDSIYNMYDSHCEISGSGNKTKKEVVRKSDHHIIINPTGTNYDKHLIHEVVKKYASANTIDSIQDPSSKFRTILISRLDKLLHNAQASLRRMIELNSHKCRFIMWCNNICNVISALKSRCVPIRVPCPDKELLFSFLNNKAIENGVIPKMRPLLDIVELSECNIKTSLWLLEKYILDIEFKNMNSYHEKFISLIEIIFECDLENMGKIRDILFNMMITCYEAPNILKEIQKRLIRSDKLSEKCKINIIMCTSQTEYNMIRKRRDIIHFDSYIVNIMKLIDNDLKKIN
jgi:replication factor C subunit 3/5